MKRSLIDTTVSGLGYGPVKSLVYKACFSTKEVEHFLSFAFWGAQKALLGGTFGLRNDAAEQFGSKCVRAHGGEMYKLLRGQTFCAMGFSLGELLGWTERSSLNLLSMADEEVAARIEAGLQQKLLPLVRPIVSLDALLRVLAADEEPFRWLYVNGAIRAAQVAFLAHQLGLEDSEIRRILRPYKRELSASLVRSADPERYLEKVIEELGSVEPS